MECVMDKVRKKIDYVVESVRRLCVACTLVLASLYFEVSTSFYPLSAETTAIFIALFCALISFLRLMQLDYIMGIIYAFAFYEYIKLSAKDLPEDYFLSLDGKWMLVSTMVVFALTNWVLVREK